MNRKVFITLAIGFLVAFNAHSAPTASVAHQANVKAFIQSEIACRMGHRARSGT
jgi:hypothetical protein